METLINPRGLTEKQLKRFFSKIEKSPTGCWLWCGFIHPKGYGFFKIFTRNFNAHRISYELHYGFIPEGLVIDHLCRVRHCVNPDHLEPVTPKENTRRGLRRQASPHNHYHLRFPRALKTLKTQCIRGHLFDELNTVYRVHTDGHKLRECKTCSKIRKLNRNRRKSSS